MNNIEKIMNAIVNDLEKVLYEIIHKNDKIEMIYNDIDEK